MIILASKSPRRKELLSFITDDFKVDSADVDETLPQNIKPDKAVEYLSKIKAEPFRSSDNIQLPYQALYFDKYSTALSGFIFIKNQSRTFQKQ